MINELHPYQHEGKYTQISLTIIVPHVEHNVSTFMNMKELLRTKRRCMAVSYGMVEQYLYNWSNYA